MTVLMLVFGHATQDGRLVQGRVLGPLGCRLLNLVVDIIVRERGMIDDNMDRRHERKNGDHARDESSMEVWLNHRNMIPHF